MTEENSISPKILDFECELKALLKVFIQDEKSRADVLKEVISALNFKSDLFDSLENFEKWAREFAIYEVLIPWAAEEDYKIAFTRKSIKAILEGFHQSEPMTKKKIGFLEYCIKKIPTRSKRIFKLHYIENLNGHQISDRVGLAADNVYKTFARFQSKLIECIEFKLERSKNADK